MDKDLRITETVVALYTFSSVVTILQAWASSAELENYTQVNSDTETASTFPDSSKFHRLLDGKVDKA